MVSSALYLALSVSAMAASVPNPPWTSGNYGYDGSGNIKSIGADRYVYDSLGRLVSGAGRTSTGTKTQQYEYDGFGNLKKISVVNGLARNIPIDSNTNRHASALYDAAGNQRNDDFVTQARTFDAFNSMTVNLDGAQYLYDANDERIAITNEARTEWRWTVRDAGTRVVREFTETAAAGGTMSLNWSRDYVYRGSALLGSYVKEGATTKRLHYHLDHLGTPRLTTDAAAVGRFAVSDYPFGEEVEPSTAATSETHHFTGHERDYNAGGTTLDYMHARYYVPMTGRFLSVDPVLGNADEPQSWNRYAYAGNDPVNHVDPTGRSAHGAIRMLVQQRDRVGRILSSIKSYTVGASYKAFDLSLKIDTHTDGQKNNLKLSVTGGFEENGAVAKVGFEYKADVVDYLNHEGYMASHPFDYAPSSMPPPKAPGTVELINDFGLKSDGDEKKKKNKNDEKVVIGISVEGLLEGVLREILHKPAK